MPQARPTTSGSAPVPGGELHYETTGGAGPAVVLLHGGMLDMGMWDEQFDWLARLGHRVIRYDARGHGRSSSVVGDYAHHEDLAALLAHLDVTSATLVGLSLGARTALDTTIARPDLVSALVLAAPGVSGRPFIDPFVRHHLALASGAIGAPDGAARFVEHFLRMWVDGPRREPAEVPPALRERIRRSAVHNVARHASGLGAGRPLEVGAADRLTEITAPTLVLHGDLDSTDISGNAEHIARGVSGTVRHVCVPSVAHMVNLEATDLVNRELHAFLTAAHG